MSNWNELQMTDKITTILQNLRYESPDHFGQPFVSPYQIVIAFAERYPDDVAKIDMPLGGAGTGEHSSLAQYIARELSKRIKSKEITHIEGAWLHKKFVRQLEFNNSGQSMVASGGIEAALSMFRLCPNPES
jgi:hypothetical protein